MNKPADIEDRRIDRPRPGRDRSSKPFQRWARQAGVLLLLFGLGVGIGPTPVEARASGHDVGAGDTLGRPVHDPEEYGRYGQNESIELDRVAEKPEQKARERVYQLVYLMMLVLTGFLTWLVGRRCN